MAPAQSAAAAAAAADCQGGLVIFGSILHCWVDTVQ